MAAVARILSVAYDESLLKTRAMLMESWGLEVVSTATARGRVAQPKACKLHQPPQSSTVPIGRRHVVS